MSQSRHPRWFVPALAVVAGILAATADSARAVLPAPVDVFTNRIHSSIVDGAGSGDANRGAAFNIATNGIIAVDNDRWDTCCDNQDFGPGATDFAGLYYATPATFDTLTVHVFNFGDGGDWESQPNVYILKENVDTDRMRPEESPYWMEISGFTETTGHAFTAVSPDNGQGGGSFTFDLTGIPLDDRTGYGWIVGGADGSNGPGINRQNFITIRELEATGDSAASVVPPVLPAIPFPTQVYATTYHSPRIGNADHDSTRSSVLEVVSNGIVHHGGAGNSDGFDTFTGDTPGTLTDFVGLKYSESMRFDSVTVELGNQFGDGGDWDSMPRVFVLNSPLYDTDVIRPETSGNWTELTGVTLANAHTFSPLVSPGPGGTIELDLSGVPASMRTGYGIAVGGVDGNAAGGGTVNFISVSELAATGVAAPAPALPLGGMPRPVNIVSNSYNSPNVVNTNYGVSRARAFEAVTDGMVFSTGQTSGFDTWQGDAGGTLTDFVGLQYNQLVRLDTLTVDLGNQFGDGGDWEETPRIFILKNPVDTGSTRPEDDPANWTEVFGASETTGHVFDLLVVPGAGGTMTFDLSAISASDRTGWGFAVGGVDGNHRASDGMWNFISVSEISATGAAVPEPSSILLLLFGASALAGRSRRKR
jgi:hypothetical protein